jgi:UrcA family protein
MNANALLSKTANLSLLALAALPMISLGFAHAEPASIKISDLDTSRPADMRTFEGRVDHASNVVCVRAPDSRDLGRIAACRQAVRAEAMDKLSKSQAQARVGAPNAG